MTITFYRVNEPYGDFSNFSRHPFELDGYTWPTVEHYYQAQKFIGLPQFHIIRQAKNAYEARLLGNNRDWPLRPDWDEVRLEMMWRALWTKFTTHAEPRTLLLATGEEEIVEASPYDPSWGAGPAGDGENLFGRMLVRLRAELRRHTAEERPA